MEQKVSIELTLNELNVVLHALAARPYGEVVNLLPALQRQAEEQVKNTEKV